ncbi:MAG: hypothetical protein P4K86_09915 [Terracidiphilus sp.]|nr:hypothetical protein [Terracidiphilus sp.]
MSPDFMDDIRLESALSKEFWLLEELEIDDVESADNKELVLCKAEIDMNEFPFHSNFSKPQLSNQMWLRDICVDCNRQCEHYKERCELNVPIPFSNWDA